jgi:hypothetical protein
MINFTLQQEFTRSLRPTLKHRGFSDEDVDKMLFGAERGMFSQFYTDGVTESYIVLSMPLINLYRNA